VVMDDGVAAIPRKRVRALKKNSFRSKTHNGTN